jgi:hypothetical protein
MESKSAHSGDTSVPCPCGTIHISQEMDSGEWIKKLWYIYTIAYYSDIKKNEIICSKIDGTGGHHVTQNKPD